MGVSMSALRRVLSVLSLTLPLAIYAERASAEIRICNNFSQTVYFSIGYAQPGYDSFMSRGWLILNPNGGCDQFDSALHLSVFWYYAETNAYYVRKHVKTTNTWGSVHPDKQLWIAQYSFNIIDNPGMGRPPDPGAKLVGFAKSIEASGSELNETLTIEADGINVTQSIKNDSQ
ncbi:DUF1036 domain-containing protein [Mesorhizobium sp. NZP2077]|nr:DUF1036 domain-containing protein [Mesorhizobium sp. NZP2077]